MYTHMAFFSPDGRYVVFAADKEIDEMVELYSVRREGGEPVKLNPPLVNGGMVHNFDVSPDSQYVVYAADQVKDDVIELFSVPIGGGETVRLNDPLVEGSKLEFDFQITPNSLGVVFTSHGAIYEHDNLYANWITGGIPVQVNPDVGDYSYMRYKISPNSQVVVLAFFFESPRPNLLYSALITGASPILLDEGFVSYDNFTISPDGSRVVFMKEEEIYNTSNLYSVPIAGGDVSQLNSPQTSGWGVQDFELSPDGQWAVYLADPAMDGVYELFSAAIGGGMPRQLNPPLESDRDVAFYKITPNSLGVVYEADQDQNNVFDIYNAPIAGGRCINSTQTWQPEALHIYF